MPKHRAPLLRSAILDYGPVEALKALVWGGLMPSHLSALELGLRALITTDSVRVWPFVEGEAIESTDADIAWPPIDDAALDYEFDYDNGRLPALQTLSSEEKASVLGLADDLLSRALGKAPVDLKARDLVTYLPPKVGNLVSRSMEESGNEELNWMFVRPMLEKQLLTLVRFHRTGAVIFSESPLANICKEHLFVRYPEELFAKLDPEWKNLLRKLVGPGLGATIPPLSAVVFSRLRKRSEVAVVVRELREEYQTSRTSLWDRLEGMWTADTLSEQMKILKDLEAASASLFPALFPQRCRFLETALSATVDLAEAKPLSALKTVGSTLLRIDENRSRVSAFGFTKQLYSDLSKVEGSDKFLRRVLSRAEQIRFGLA